MANALPRTKPFLKPVEAPAEPVVAPAKKRGVQAWLVERLGLEALVYPVPAHANGLLYTLVHRQATFSRMAR